MRKISLAVLIIFAITTLSGVTYAQSPDATKSAVKKDNAAQRTQERLEQLKDRRSTKSATIKERVRDKVRRRAHVLGEITAIDGTNLIIQTRSDAVKTILTDTETKFVEIGKGGKKEIKFADLKVGDRIAAVGIAKDENTGTARFVVRLIKPDKNRHAVFGEVSETGNNQLTISHLIHKDKPTTTVKVTSDTKIKIKGKEEATFTDIKVGDRVATSGTVDEKGVITAKRLFVIPGKFTGAKPQEATKSATKSAN